MQSIQFVQANYLEIIKVLGAILAVGQIVVRLTPTIKDDGFLTRIGKAYDSVCDFLKIPNNSKSL